MTRGSVSDLPNIFVCVFNGKYVIFVNRSKIQMKFFLIVGSALLLYFLFSDIYVSSLSPLVLHEEESEAEHLS